MAALNFITFNQDNSCLAVGTSKGLRIYHTDPFSKIFSSDDGNVSIVEMLFSTSLVAVVLSPRRLIIQNTKRASVICELTFPSAVLAVRLNRKRLAVVLEEEIYLYDISNMQLLHTIATSPNPQAICALSPSSTNCFLAYPMPKPRDLYGHGRRQSGGADSAAAAAAAVAAASAGGAAVAAASSPQSQSKLSRTSAANAGSGSGANQSAIASTAYLPPTSGEVLIFDTATLRAINVVEAHKAPLSCVALNSDGSLLATASETGTIIRVFSLPHGRKIFQFRRGTYPSSISSMSFNLSSTLLCVSSSSDTVHIFKLAAPDDKDADGASSAAFTLATGTATTSSTTATTSDLLPTSSTAASTNPTSATSTSSYNFKPKTSLSSLSRNESPSPDRGRGRTRNVNSPDPDSPSNSSPSRDRDGKPIISPAPAAATTAHRASGSFGSILRRSSQLMGRSVAAYLPQTVTEMWEPLRDFASIKIPKSTATAGAGADATAAAQSAMSLGSGTGGDSSSSLGLPSASSPSAAPPAPPTGPVRSVVAMSSNSPQVMVVTSDGKFYVFNIDLELGGEGYLVRQSRWVNDTALEFCRTRISGQRSTIPPTHTKRMVPPPHLTSIFDGDDRMDSSVYES